MALMKIIATILFQLSRVYNRLYGYCMMKGIGYCGHHVILHRPSVCSNLKSLYLYDNTSIMKNWSLISTTGKFIMKENSGAASGLTVITGNHHRLLNHTLTEIREQQLADVEKDVIVEEEVWIGANVTLLAGVTVGRGSTIGAGTVLKNTVPPYSIVMGNPAKIIGFTFTPEEAIKHEEMFYKEDERTPLELLEKNYVKYLLKRTKEIRDFTKL